MPNQWHAVSTAPMCARCLVCWLRLALQPFNMPRMRKRVTPVCGICCKVLLRLKPYVADMGLLLPLLPLGTWRRAASSTTDNQCVRALDPDSSGARILLNQGQ